MIKKYVFFLLLIIGIIPSIIGLFHLGFPVTDDGSWMIVRFSAFYQVLRHGQFPVRFLISLNHEYGYPVADFLYPLFMYIGVPIHLLGFGFINTIKIILGGSLVLSGIFCYLWLRECFGRGTIFCAPTIGALCYVFFPYHLFDVYQRGSVGEVLALAIVPFIFWQIERKNMIWIASCIALLILAHNSLALLFLPVISIYGYMRVGTKYLLSLLLGLCLSAFFWIPALYDKQFTVFDTLKVSDFSQYFLTAKNFGLFGVFALMISMVSVSYLVKKNDKYVVFFLSITYIGLLFSLPVSSLIWKLLPLPELVQFPFRFLSIVIPGIAFLTAYMIDHMKTSLKIVLVIVCIGVIYLSSWQYLFPRYYQSYPDGYYSTNQDTTTVKNEYMPKWVKQIPLSSAENKVEIVKESGSLTNITTNTANTISFTAHISRPSTVRINIIYFPGWEIFVNNKAHSFSYHNEKGVMEVSLPAGDNHIVTNFRETPIRLITDGISLFSVILGIFVLIRNKCVPVVDGDFSS